MKLHDLQPAPGSHQAKTRVGRGIAAGKGKTAGRGTKGQKARAGGSIPPWFEGGQTPLHMRIPKLRGFRNRGKVEYEVVNVGDIAARIEAGAFTAAGTAPKKGEPMTINADILRAVGLVRDVRKPLKVLGDGELSTALFVVADAFTKSATAKIEAAGGSVNVLEVPAEPRPALGVDEPASASAPEAPAKAAKPARAPKAAKGAAASDRATDETPDAPAATAAPEPEASAAPAAQPADEASSDADEPADAPDAVADEAPAEADAADGTDEVTTDSTDSTDESA
ncbi:MAG TPA: 50S ribosomal protein L15 [Candidatus Limnocylindrales bacterium]|jgi:large subunit ribosomal protein L15|nr:50S ribosomal protein L15 [Candidatus Limnocylindrales bacterium]